MNIPYQKDLPITGSFDVVVVGGGPAGIGAALAAAKAGMKTALIERFGFLGGMATAGYVDPMSEFSYNGELVTGGIPWAFANALVEAGGGLVEEPRCNVSFNPEIYKLVAERLLLEAGVRLFMNTVLADAIVRDDEVKEVVISNKNGLSALRAKVFIDASGDADLAAMAGVEMLPSALDRQPGTLCFILSHVDTSTERMHIIHQKNHRFNHQATFIREPLLKLRSEGVDVPQFGGPWLCTTLEEGCITVNMTRSAMDALDAENYQDAAYKMRQDVFKLVALIRENVPEFRHCQLSSVATVAGIRESRRIRGMHILTGQEYVDTVRFEDSIARACHPVDIHLPNGEGQKLTFPKAAGYIPYRSLVPLKIRNLLVAGRCISADNEAFAAIRVQAPCMETGQAAGFAAGIAVSDGVSVREVNTERLVERVREEGSRV